MADKRPTDGFWKMYYRIRKEGLVWNHKRIHRVYKLLKLNIKRKGKRRLPARILKPLEAVQQINVSWSMDFMSDSLLSGRKFRTFNLMVFQSWGACYWGWHFVTCRTDHPRSGPDHWMEGKTTKHPCRQWAWVHFKCSWIMVRGKRYQPAIHPAREANTECLHRTIQWKL